MHGRNYILAVVPRGGTGAEAEALQAGALAAAGVRTAVVACGPAAGGNAPRGGGSDSCGRSSAARWRTKWTAASWRSVHRILGMPRNCLHLQEMISREIPGRSTRRASRTRRLLELY